ncbi:MAG: hypothetical protein M3453_08375 [Pseudomonadota bacterium]|nr:hypothetical protein [Pseudomonadota bacterium]
MTVSQALALLSSGDWNAAHELVQDDPSPEAAWMHAHLHRVEGDLANAGYWYRRADRPVATGGLEEERREIERFSRAARSRSTLP